MASTVIEKFTVSELSKYGFRVGDEYINFSKLFTDQAKIVPGAQLEGEFYVADSSKRYLNKVLNAPVIVPAKTPPPTITKKSEAAVPVKKAFVPKAKVEEVSKGLSKDEWANKDRRISRQGLIQASLIALAPVVSLELLFSEAAKLAEQGLEFVNKA